MEPTKMGEGWKPTGTGVLVPPGASAAPSVERATFAVKVQGFAPPNPEPGWNGLPVSVRFTGHLFAPVHGGKKP